MAGVRQAPGGASSICLGLDDSELKAMNSISSNAFASNTSQNSGNVLTERPSTVLLAPPGGHSTICLGEAPEVKQLVPPGGKSSICLGMDSKEAAAPVSSNAFACGVSQNCGNVLTERPTTHLHAPPGGHSTICLGHDGAVGEVKSQSRPVGGADHITWDAPPPAAAPHRAPAGGKSSICFGAESSAQQAIESTEVEAPLTRRVPAGGASTVCLGTDISEWSLTSRALGHSRSEMMAEEPQVEAVNTTECQEPNESKTEEIQAEIEEKSEAQSEPIEDLGGVLSEKLEADDVIKVQSNAMTNVTALQDLPTPARRAPPGGVATVLLG